MRERALDALDHARGQFNVRIPDGDHALRVKQVSEVVRCYEPYRTAAGGLDTTDANRRTKMLGFTRWDKPEVVLFRLRHIRECWLTYVREIAREN